MIGDIFNFVVTHPREMAFAFAVCAVGAVTGAIALFIVAARQIAETEIPPNADFFETLQYLPITVPIALDLLDMAFDVFAAPIAWVILELLGLQSLQMVTVFEGLIPGTQLLPTMTGAWVVARMMKNRQPKTELRESLHQYQLEQRIQARRHSLSQHRTGQALPPPSSSSRPSRASWDSGEYVEGEYYEEDMDYLPLDHDEEDW